MITLFDHLSKPDVADVVQLTDALFQLLEGFRADIGLAALLSVTLQVLTDEATDQRDAKDMAEAITHTLQCGIENHFSGARG